MSATCDLWAAAVSFRGLTTARNCKCCIASLTEPPGSNNLCLLQRLTPLYLHRTKESQKHSSSISWFALWADRPCSKGWCLQGKKGQTDAPFQNWVPNLLAWCLYNHGGRACSWPASWLSWRSHRLLLVGHWVEGRKHLFSLSLMTELLQSRKSWTVEPAELARRRLWF